MIREKKKKKKRKRRKKKRRGPVKVEGWLYFGFCGLCCTQKSNHRIWQQRK